MYSIRLVRLQAFSSLDIHSKCDLISYCEVQCLLTPFKKKKLWYGHFSWNFHHVLHRIIRYSFHLFNTMTCILPLVLISRLWITNMFQYSQSQADHSVKLKYTIHTAKLMTNYIYNTIVLPALFNISLSTFSLEHQSTPSTPQILCIIWSLVGYGNSGHISTSYLIRNRKRYHILMDSKNSIKLNYT